jgi:hypothetical protein
MKTIYHCCECGLICECEPRETPPEGWQRVERIDGSISWACPEDKNKYFVEVTK